MARKSAKTIMNTKENLTFKEADEFRKLGECIALPEWGGFWFGVIRTGQLLVLTKDGEILDTPSEEFKSRNDWKVVKPTEEQQKLLDFYFIKTALKTSKPQEMESKAERNVSETIQQTLGQKAVGLSFNPSNLSDVDKVKRAFADLIDICNTIPTTSYLGNTLKGMAIRACIEAQMCVVKLITFKE